MAAIGQCTIGESMAMAAMMTGVPVEEVDGFIVITTNADGDGRVIHNSTSYLNLITTLLGHAQCLIGEMKVDQAIEFHLGDDHHG